MKHATGLLFGSVIAMAAASGAAWGQDKLDLRVLYAGKPDSDRMAEFEALLDQHFVDVATVSYEAFTAADADDYDVVIFDWPSIYARDAQGVPLRDNFSLQVPNAPPMPEDWDRPSLLIGAAGERIAERFRSKIDWL